MPRPRRPRQRGSFWHSNIGERPPPGLRGRDIGMFYKNRSKNNPQKEFTIALNIPAQVISRVENHLLTINTLAKEENITIPSVPQIEQFCQVKVELDESQAGTSMDTDTPHYRIRTYKEPDNIIRQNRNFVGPSNETQESVVKCDVEIKTEPKTELQDDSEIAGTFREVEDTQVDTENQLSWESNNDYKYSYKDITTGTFHEKLESAIKDGIAIRETPMVMGRDLNDTLHDEYMEMISTPAYKNMLSFRETLPAYKKSQEILEALKNNQVIIVSGETGCGKSTQIPQLILDDALSRRGGACVRVVVTEPRRIAASSLAARVAQERGEGVGGRGSVGYAVRLERKEPRPRGSIVYWTTGVLLSDLETSPALGGISHLLLDEVHERDCHVDLAMSAVKLVLKKRTDLKVVLMSATLDAVRLSSYFDDCPVLTIEGLAYPVKDVYLEEILEMTGFRLKDCPLGKGGRQPEGDVKRQKDAELRAEAGQWVRSLSKTLSREVQEQLLDSDIEETNYYLIMQLLKYISRDAPGGVLVFVPGIAEISGIIKVLEDSGSFPRQAFDIHPVHSKLSSVEQKRIFERPLGGKRKIVVATNIAETSITIDDIVYVVDAGKIKLKGLNIEDNISTLTTQWIAKDNMMQRRGRAGRCQPGVCYHLFTSHRCLTLPPKHAPELQRCELLDAVLTVKRLRLGGAGRALALAPDPPADCTVRRAVAHLQECGILSDGEALTPLGRHVARLPTGVAAGRLLLLAAALGCLDRALALAAVWGFRDPFVMVVGKQDQVDRRKRELSRGEPSDHVAAADAVLRWEALSGAEQSSFAYDYFLSPATLRLLRDSRRQLADSLRAIGFLSASRVPGSWEDRNAGNVSLFKAVVAASLYPNVASVKWMNMRARNPNKPLWVSATIPGDGRVAVHPSSVVAGPIARYAGQRAAACNSLGANWLVYTLKQRSTKLFVHDVTLVYTLPLLFFGEIKVTYDRADAGHCFIIISRLRVRMRASDAQTLLRLRAHLDHVLAGRVAGGAAYGRLEEAVFDAVIELITAEDEQSDDTSFGRNDEDYY